MLSENSLRSPLCHWECHRVWMFACRTADVQLYQIQFTYSVKKRPVLPASYQWLAICPPSYIHDYIFLAEQNVILSKLQHMYFLPVKGSYLIACWLKHRIHFLISFCFYYSNVVLLVETLWHTAASWWM